MNKSHSCTNFKDPCFLCIADRAGLLATTALYHTSLYWLARCKL